MRHDEMREAARSPEDACSPAGLNYEELQRYHATCSKVCPPLSRPLILHTQTCLCQLDERSIELLLDRLDELAIEIHGYLLGSSDEEDGDRFLPQ
jgi:hypothetical protein